MTNEVLDGAPQGAADDAPVDLRSTIVAAVEKQREAPAEVVEKVAPVVPEKVEAKSDDRSRDDKGRFAQKVEGGAEAEVKPDAAKAAAEIKPEGDGEKKDEALAVKPPGGWSPTAKAAFNELPEAVKEAVAKREQEVNNGFAKLAEYKPIDRFVEMAKQSGTTLDRALENYVGIENALRSDFLGGIGHLCQRYGTNPVALANAILARSGSPSQRGEVGTNGADQNGSQLDLSPLQQKISALESQLQQQNQRFAQQDQLTVQSEITRFASDPKNVFFDNVKSDMGNLIDKGIAQDLQQAYDMACWNNPEIRGLLIKQQTPAASSAKAVDAVQQAKAAAKAVGGAPSAGFKPDATASNLSIRDTIRAAVEAQRGA